ncbi:MAG: lipoyl synthase [Bacteroidales bacterium]|nr:lipoyl synthase [Lentimicrobiaceae bacterium]MDD5694423.1 lipoyl synthase [Bacteroidales bacterium]
MIQHSSSQHKPPWLKIKIPAGKQYVRVKDIVHQHKLHTICESGHCPNIADCWGRGTATFMILGDICTRSCKFCNVKTGRPLPADPDEPAQLAHTVRLMNLSHCVVTSVDRDDLPDGGAAAWAATIRAIKEVNPGITIEALIPDFDGEHGRIRQVIDSRPEVISHNLETVRRLTPLIRSRARYDVSLNVIQTIAESGIVAKSGIMAGLGETAEEVAETMDDLIAAGCTVLTIGQYLQPTRRHIPVAAYISPEQFANYRILGLQKGFSFVESSPLVRSSFQAEKHVRISI